MGTEKEKKKIAQSFREAMQKRNITDTKAQLIYLRDQKIKKKNASLARAKEAEREIDIIGLMLEGKI